MTKHPHMYEQTAAEYREAVLARAAQKPCTVRDLRLVIGTLDTDFNHRIVERIMGRRFRSGETKIR